MFRDIVLHYLLRYSFLFNSGNMVTTMRPKLNVKKILQAGKGRVRKEKNILLRERERENIF